MPKLITTAEDKLLTPFARTVLVALRRTGPHSVAQLRAYLAEAGWPAAPAWRIRNALGALVAHKLAQRCPQTPPAKPTALYCAMPTPAHPKPFTQETQP